MKSLEIVHAHIRNLRHRERNGAYSKEYYVLTAEMTLYDPETREILIYAYPVRDITIIADLKDGETPYVIRDSGKITVHVGSEPDKKRGINLHYSIK